MLDAAEVHEQREDLGHLVLVPLHGLPAGHHLAVRELLPQPGLQGECAIQRQTEQELVEAL